MCVIVSIQFALLQVKARKGTIMAQQAYNVAQPSITAIIQAYNDKPIVIYPVYVRLTGDYASAAALSQVLYWHKTMKRKFYKTDVDFMQELFLTSNQFKRVKSVLKSLDFIIITREQIPAKTFYDVDYDKLAVAIAAFDGSSGSDFGFGSCVSSDYKNYQSTLQGDTLSSLVENHQSIPTDAPLSSLVENHQSNTENTTENTQNNNVVVFDGCLKLPENLSTEEKQEAVKIIKMAPLEYQQAILLCLTHVLLKGSVRSPLGYLQGLVNKAKSGTFQPLQGNALQSDGLSRPYDHKPKELPKVDNLEFFKQQYKLLGEKVLSSIPEQYRSLVVT